MIRLLYNIYLYNNLRIFITIAESKHATIILATFQRYKCIDIDARTFNVKVFFHQSFFADRRFIIQGSNVTIEDIN